MLRKAIALAALGLAFVAGPATASSGEDYELREVDWSFTGPFGKFEPAQVQRGYKVYREVCAACHSMNLMFFRNLGQKHGPFYDAEYGNPNDNPYVKALAKDMQVADIDSETGDEIMRAATPADKFPSPFKNEAAARASNGGAYPPDLSAIVKSREGGADYVYSILTGYVTPPAGLRMTPTQHYNAYFPGDLKPYWEGKGEAPPGGFIAMAPPLAPDKVTFDDGTKSTINQQAEDVVAFLAWASDPKQTERKAFGLGAMIYLLIFAVLLYFSYRRIWRNVAH